jgi:ATP-dependent Lon protease
MVPLRDLVVFPYMIVPIFVTAKPSILALEEAIAKGRMVYLTPQKSEQVERPTLEDVYKYGTVAKILQMLKLPDGSRRVLIEGTERACLVRGQANKEFWRVQVRPVSGNDELIPPIDSLMRTARKEFDIYARLHKKVPAEVLTKMEKIKAPNRLADTICASAQMRVDDKVKLLAIPDTKARLETLITILMGEIEVLELEKKIRGKVKKRLEESQKQYFLNEQLKEIQKELGKAGDDPTGATELEERLSKKGLPEEVLAKCRKEVKRLARLQPISPESGVLRTYLEWICDLPWKEYSHDSRDIEKARTILDEDHYSLDKVKERILDFIAVRQLKDKVKGPILCFIGPPGTGKTSLGRSVARCLGREFVRISLGGVRDEAEIRGHRKTYIGALPGKIIQSMRKATTRNPVFLLDEIDKMSSDFRGDPASAMLEVLDPEQNSTFTDHYLEVQYDLSDVMFITTANSVHNIPYPLRDRMEIIEISGYTELEKEKIAEHFLVPKQIEENGLGWADISFHRPAIATVIRNYTMESGVRNLERQIADVLRKIAREAVKRGISAEEGAKQKFSRTITSRSIGTFLGKPKYQETKVTKDLKPGLSHGLAWTELGGVLLPVEIALLKGKGELFLTGSLGDVMKESAQTALSFLRANARQFSIPEDFNENRDIHIHVPEGAIPKDGPSAGITITAALLSAITNLTIPAAHAMTGEITLTGRLLPVGGVKEKVLAAHRNKMTHVLMPEGNRKDIDELPKEVVSSVDFIFADAISDALFSVFPQELRDSAAAGASGKGRKKKSGEEAFQKKSGQDTIGGKKSAYPGDSFSRT